ncbi:MAG: alanine racemase [Deltaproteobacteria bacterium]|nr:alanine racemase [Deltaproteobacteria bacterium]
MTEPRIFQNNSKAKIEDVSGPWIEVDLDAVSHNIKQISRFSRTRLMPVIKANAYGHGAVQVARHLEQMEPVHALCVGIVREALELRESGLKVPLLNLGQYTKTEAEHIVALNISQSVFTDAVAWLDRAARQQNRIAGVHIKIDTGLGRVGVPHHKALEFIEQVANMANVRIEGVFTSFSEDLEFDKIQMKRFQSVLSQAEARGISLGITHAASSAAVLAYPESGLDMIRPGIMVFGHYPSVEEWKLKRINLKPALTLKARVVYVKNLTRGDPIAYHQAYKARGDETIITGGIGYSDGYPTGLAGRAECLIRGTRHSLIAAVTANHISVRSRRDDIELGDEIVLYGKQGKEEILLENIAQLSGYSEYELLTRLHPLLPRFYS